MNTQGKVEAHRRAVQKTTIKCLKRGIKIRQMPQCWCEYDLLANDEIKIEVKVAIVGQPHKGSDYLDYRFNIHRHGKMATEKIDFYVFYLPPMKPLGFRFGITLIVPGKEVKSKVVSISARQLIFTWSKWINRWDLIEKFQRAVDTEKTQDNVPS